MLHGVKTPSGVYCKGWCEGWSELLHDSDQAWISVTTFRGPASDSDQSTKFGKRLLYLTYLCLCVYTARYRTADEGRTATTVCSIS